MTTQDSSSTTGSLERLIDLYCEGWSVASASERERLIRTALTSDATYCDPRTDAVTIPDLLAHITRILAGRPGARVIRTSNVDTHHGCARFHWCVVMPDGTRLPEGIDIVELSADGRQIKRILGFFGPLRPMAT